MLVHYERPHDVETNVAMLPEGWDVVSDADRPTRRHELEDAGAC
jgi:hypothetical protein